MAGFTMTRHVSAPQAMVFEYVTDLRRAPERISGITRMEVLTEGPIRAGTRFKETRMMFKRECTEEMEVTAFDPPRRYALGCDSCGCRYHSEFLITPNGNGTDVKMSFDAKPLSLFAKIMSVVMRPMMKSCERAIAQDLDDLKAAIESDTSTSRDKA
jgi:carbon monoxide dehydrogenase subunit G